MNWPEAYSEIANALIDRGHPRLAVFGLLILRLPWLIAAFTPAIAPEIVRALGVFG